MKTSLLMELPFVPKLGRVYSNSLKMSNGGELRSDFLRTARTFRKRKKNRRRLVTSSMKRNIRHFHVVVLQ